MDDDTGRTRFMDLYAVVYDDVIECMEEMLARPTQRRRRSFVRAALAAIEAFTSNMKQRVLQNIDEKWWALGHEFTPAEIAMLREETYELSRREAYVKPKFPPLYDNFVFAVTMHYHQYEDDFQLDIGNEGYQRFRKAIDVRHRITHPKNADAVTITGPRRRSRRLHMGQQRVCNCAGQTYGVLHQRG